MFTLKSTAFKNGGEIPVRYTCQGDNISPPLSWSDTPEGTRSLALIVEDPDAPDPAAPERTWVHWVLYNIPPTVTELPEGVMKLPEGTLEGINDWEQEGYGGPCPPVGRHRYFHILYALDITVREFPYPPDRQQIWQVIADNVLAETQLVGTYQKK
ncbi:MAG TPA: YbhB/YbcL family Raf kinase inhibitor-like protein [Gammaproteobacteria bacterium]